MNEIKTLKDHVYDYIADKIITGEITKNEKINENLICEKLNISRTPVREALIALSCDGIIENVPRKGFIVKTLTLKDIYELYTIIGTLEAKAATLACNNLSDRDLKDMQFYVDAMNVAIEGENFEMYNKQQINFHQAFIEKCGNDMLISTIADLKRKLLKRSYNIELLPNIKDILTETNREHQQILDFLKAKDYVGCSNFIADVHWSENQAEFDV